MLKLPFLKSILARNSINGVYKKVFYSSSSKLRDQIVVSDDGSTVICWHPEPKFPYECSRPLPEKPKESASVLKVQTTEALKAIYRPKKEELVRQELMALTHTTKHRWFPKARIWKRKNTPMERPFL